MILDLISFLHFINDINTEKIVLISHFGVVKIYILVMIIVNLKFFNFYPSEVFFQRNIFA